MKMLLRDMLSALLWGAILPALLMGIWIQYSQRLPSVITQDAKSEACKVRNMYVIPVHLPDGSREIMELESYLVGVLLGEVPASFEMEALKAQAVVARTYTMRALCNGGKHGDGGICTDPACCQAYVSLDSYMREGGTQSEMDRMAEAVKQTEGSVLLYDGEFIEASYFSCSGGFTEAAVSVWGMDYPYLQSVLSPGEENAPYFRSEMSFSRQALESALSVSLSRFPVDWLTNPTYSEGGGVEQVEIGGKKWKGTELRQKLGLRSTAFDWTAGDNDITFYVRGYGHRVGMSQYGAEAMAVSGMEYGDILRYYYPGTERCRWEEVHP